MIMLLTLISYNSFAEEGLHYEIAMQISKIPEGKKLDELIDSMVRAQIKQNPRMGIIRKAYEKFYKETFTSKEVKSGIAKIHMDIFSYKELLDLKKLMELPIYKKYMDKNPEILYKSSELSNRIFFKNKNRLKELIDKETKHIERLKKLDKELMLTYPE